MTLGIRKTPPGPLASRTHDLDPAGNLKFTCVQQGLRLVLIVQTYRRSRTQSFAAPKKNCDTHNSDVSVI